MILSHYHTVTDLGDNRLALYSFVTGRLHVTTGAVYKQLKDEYDHKTLVDEAKVQGISKRTAERWNISWIETGQIKKISHGLYQKVA